jgi:transcriptional regulator with XRE-family HTH domain
MQPPDIVARIRDLRVKKGLSLARISEITGLSKGYLSKIENADSIPPVSTLHRIATALGTNLSYFFTARDAQPPREKLAISRKRDWTEKEPEVQATEIRRWPLTEQKFGRNMFPYVIELPADHHQVYQFEGEEFYFLMEGEVELDYGGSVYRLEAGDSAYFDGDVPYSGRSIGDGPAKLLMVSYSYKRVAQDPFFVGLLPYRKLEKPEGT